ncbi:hypothetical protein TDB9533_02759 [Thalassocella blandensis]|nr:hypothetical protein TDB9533_02759 [Thalassocella blandensis]
MKKISSWLSIVLILQLMVAGGLFFTKQQSGNEEQNAPLISYARESLNKIIISDPRASITLEKDQDRWVLPDYQHVPVSQAKLDDILEVLHGVKAGWPVAASSSSHERFEVEEDNFQKKVQLFSGSQLLSELYIGTSPGYRKAHVRRGDNDKVYTADISSFEYSVESSDWLNKEALLIEDVSVIKAKDYELEKQGETWLFTGDNSEEVVDAAKAKTLVGALEKLHVQAVAAPEFKPTVKPAEVVVMVKGKALTYQFSKEKGTDSDSGNADRYYVKRSDLSPTFVISKSAYENILQKTIQDLAIKPDASNSESDIGDMQDS